MTSLGHNRFAPLRWRVLHQIKLVHLNLLHLDGTYPLIPRQQREGNPQSENSFSRLTSELPVKKTYYFQEIRLTSSKTYALSYCILQSAEHYKTSIHCYEFASHYLQWQLLKTPSHLDQSRHLSKNIVLKSITILKGEVHKNN